MPRPFAFWLPLVCVCLLVAACGGGTSAPSPTPASPQVMIARCERAHGLKQPAQTVTQPYHGAGTDDGGLPKDAEVYSATLFTSCIWPPPSFGGDGFVQVRQITKPGPDPVDAGGAYVADVYLAPCDSLKITLQGQRAGSEGQKRELTVRRGQIVSAFTGQAWTGPRSAIPFQVPQDSAVVMRNFMVGPTMATCTGQPSTSVRPTPRVGALRPQDAIGPTLLSQWNTPQSQCGRASVADGCPITQRLEKRLGWVRAHPSDQREAICRCEGPVTNVALGRPTVEAATAHIPANMTFAYEQPQHFRVTVLRQNGGWLVDDVTCSDGGRSVYVDLQRC